MSDQHAIDRYADARERLDMADKHIKNAGELLSRIGAALRARPITLPIEGIGDWTAIAKNPDTLRKDEWFDFDRLRSMIQNYREAQEAEIRAWNSLSPQHQRLIKRE